MTIRCDYCGKFISYDDIDERYERDKIVFNGMMEDFFLRYPCCKKCGYVGKEFYIQPWGKSNAEHLFEIFITARCMKCNATVNMKTLEDFNPSNTAQSPPSPLPSHDK